jgi:hypothetical protein
MSKTYLISLDLLDPTLDLDGLKEFIKTSAMFENWWNHIPGVFLVVSDRDAVAMSKAVRHYTNDARFLVIETNPEDSDGWISERGWRWVRRRSEKAEKSAAE